MIVTIHEDKLKVLLEGAYLCGYFDAKDDLSCEATMTAESIFLRDILLAKEANDFS